ncbi:MAG TPA: HAMP domain-containing protein [Lautropia sp.]|nr:HAMP domain-containing protein [Lautropia sp.]
MSQSLRAGLKIGIHALPRSQPPDLAAILFRRTLQATAAVALIATVGLGALTIFNVRQEVRAAQELVEQAVHASMQTAAEPGGASLAPDHAMLRGLRLQLVDPRDAAASQAGGLQEGLTVLPLGPRNLLERLAERWFGVTDHFSIPLTSDPDGPALLVRGHAVGELQEQLTDLAIVLGALALAVAALGLAHAWVVRSVRDPLTDMTGAAVSMAEGELSRRIVEPRVAEFAALARALNHLAESLEQTRAVQTELTAELVSLREDERKSLARELHDDLGQRLAVVAAETHLLRAQLKGDSQTASAIAAGIQALQLSVRSMLERLRQGQPVVMPDPDAAAVLDDWRRREPGVRWQADDLRGPLKKMDEPSAEALARVLQEALANAFRHARPSSVWVRLSRETDAWHVVIRNDGMPEAGNGERPQAKGVAPEIDGVSASGEAVPAAAPAGHGVLGMRERAHGAGGSLRAGPAGSGCWEVALRLPGLKAKAAAALQGFQEARG